MFKKRTERILTEVEINVDGVTVTAEEGEPLAAVFLRQRDMHCRRTHVSGAPRAPFCMMGVCFDCLAIVDGEAGVQTCLVPVRPGMVVTRQLAPRTLTPEASTP